MDKKNGTVLAKIIAYKFGYDGETVGKVADDMIRDDFPLTNIKTIGQAITYLDFVHDEVCGR